MRTLSIVIICVLIGSGIAYMVYIPPKQSTKNHGSYHNFFIQVPLESSVIREMQERLQPEIEKIVHDTLGFDQDKNFPILYFKKREALTIYYVNDLFDSGDPLQGLMYLFLRPVLNKTCASPAPQHVRLSSNLTYFGEPKEGLFSTLDLVMLIDDTQKELAALNAQAKQAMHFANFEYKSAYQTNLYDIASSEKFSYVPHISLGHIRVNYIKFLLHDEQRAIKAIEDIKARFKAIVEAFLVQINPENKALPINKIALYDIEKRTFVEECNLS